MTVYNDQVILVVDRHTLEEKESTTIFQSMTVYNEYDFQSMTVYSETQDTLKRIPYAPPSLSGSLMHHHP